MKTLKQFTEELIKTRSGVIKTKYSSLEKQNIAAQRAMRAEDETERKIRKKANPKEINRAYRRYKVYSRISSGKKPFSKTWGEKLMSLVRK